MNDAEYCSQYYNRSFGQSHLNPQFTTIVAVVCHPQWIFYRLHARAEAKRISAGNQHTLVLGIDGSVWAAGDNFYGQLGAGDTGFDTRKKTFKEVLSTMPGECGWVLGFVCRACEAVSLSGCTCICEAQCRCTGWCEIVCSFGCVSVRVKAKGRGRGSGVRHGCEHTCMLVCGCKGG